MISSAFSGRPSFFTKGNTANLIGAKAAGNFNTTRLSPFSKVSSQ